MIEAVNDENSLAFNSKSRPQPNTTETKMFGTMGDEDFIKNFLIDVMPQQSKKIIDEAQKAILEFDLSAKITVHAEDKAIGLITPPAHGSKKSPPISTSGLNKSLEGLRRSEFKQTGATS